MKTDLKKKVLVDGKVYNSIMSAAKAIGVKYNSLYYSLNYGVSKKCFGHNVELYDSSEEVHEEKNKPFSAKDAIYNYLNNNIEKPDVIDMDTVATNNSFDCNEAIEDTLVKALKYSLVQKKYLVALHVINGLVELTSNKANNN